MAWTDYLREIPDFPKAGVLFRDILPVMAHAPAWQEVLSLLEGPLRQAAPDLLAAPEARGFALAGALASRLGIGLLLVRKAGKLPDPVVSERYTLEYGESQLEMEADKRLDGLRVALVDDVLATGGTMQAAQRLIGQLGGTVVSGMFMVELTDLGGRQRLMPQVPVYALAKM